MTRHPNFAQTRPQPNAFFEISTSQFEQALFDEELYGDGWPTWDRAPTSVEALEKAVATIARLRRFDKKNSGAAALADRLEECAPGNRCGSNACPECLRAFQRWLVLQILALAKIEDRTEVSLYALTIIPVEAQVPLGQLDSVDIAAFLKKCRRALRASGAVRWGIMALDTSFNDEAAKGNGSFWQTHLHGIVAITNKKSLAKALRKAFPSTKRVYRPWKPKRYDGSPYGASYLFKPEAYRRISYRAKTESREFWAVIDPPPRLTAKQHVESLVASDALGFTGRVLTFRISPIRSKHKLRLKPQS